MYFLRDIFPVLKLGRIDRFRGEKSLHGRALFRFWYNRTRTRERKKSSFLNIKIDIFIIDLLYVFAKIKEKKHKRMKSQKKRTLLQKEKQSRSSRLGFWVEEEELYITLLPFINESDKNKQNLQT